MYEALFQLLVSSGITLAPPMVRLIAAGLDAWVQEIHRMNLPPTLAGTVIDIIQQVNANPLIADASDIFKKELVRGAVARAIINSGGTSSDKAVNLLIEVALHTLGVPVEEEPVEEE